MNEQISKVVTSLEEERYKREKRKMKQSTYVPTARDDVDADHDLIQFKHLQTSNPEIPLQDAITLAKDICAHYPDEKSMETRFAQQMSTLNNTSILQDSSGYQDILTLQTSPTTNTRTLHSSLMSQKQTAHALTTKELSDALALHQKFPDNYNVALLVAYSREIISRLDPKTTQE